ncbi:Alanine--tRNA ligase, cytoplasmic [Halotydeus destructor]|nr:Alanine--tRNA ligase, cytoplasmic [Halotydeus destructor]
MSGASGVVALNAKEVRQRFIDFFVKKYNHVYVHSSPVVPHDDPTLLFANAGMNQYKPIFLGTVDPNSDMAKWKRAANTQKCIRAGGKHNDLDDVGKDTYHHTFFEMLGNWSFGDFFKKEITAWAWELLTVEYGLDPNRLYVTYFGGHPEAGLEPDNECRDMWVNDLGVPAEHVLPGSMKDNFWEMGETGPCGPCSEIHYDRIGGGRNAAKLVNMDDPDVLEIWNLVFIQFNRESDGSLRKLPKQHVDTGMGFERLVSVIQDKRSNYDTDVFTPLFDAIQRLTGSRSYTGLLGKEDVDGVDMAYRVVADHARTLTIALSDGGRPDNVGRGYVLRRILRRAVRYASEKLSAPQGTFAQLVPVVVETLGDVFPELHKDPQLVIDIILDEEAQFMKTLTRGKRLLERTIAKLDGSNILPGDIAWRLYDTYGFPVDLTYLMVEEKGLVIDMKAFEESKAKAILASQAKSTQQGTGSDLDVHAIDKLQKELKIQATEDIHKYNYTSADDSMQAKYNFEPISAKIVALRHQNAFVSEIKSGNECGVILDKTSFYAESGGQMGDTGFLTKDHQEDEAEFEVREVKMQGGYVVHMGNVASGSLKVGDELKVQIDDERRKQLMNNHTGTHILNYALRRVLTSDADQKGSLVAPDRLRFDFTNKSSMSAEQVKQTEIAARELIQRNVQVYAKDTKLAEAKAIQGLRAVFNETYPDPVRVVSIGISVDDLLNDPAGPGALETSVEFCGGTHLLRSGHVGDFVIASEDAIAKGVRRIIALTGPEASKAVKKAQVLSVQVQTVRDNIKNSPADQKNHLKQIVELMDEISQSNISYWLKDDMRTTLTGIRKELDNLEKSSKASQLNENIEFAKSVAEKNADKPFIVEVINAGSNSKAVDAALKQIRTALPNMPAMFFSHDDKKIICLTNVPPTAIANGLKANEWVQQINSVINGKGGGKPESAQASGTKIGSLSEALDIAKQFANLKLSTN